MLIGEAVHGIESINRDYEEHSRAARKIAEEVFVTDRILPALLDAANAMKCRMRKSNPRELGEALGVRARRVGMVISGRFRSKTRVREIRPPIHLPTSVPCAMLNGVTQKIDKGRRVIPPRS